MRVLIVDDSEICLELMTLICRKVGLEVLSAGSSQQALACLTRERVDLVVLDYCLPDLDGLATLEQVRRRLGDGAPPVIFVTALAQPAVVATLRSSNPVEVLAKPFSVRQLQASLHRALHFTSIQ